jgi:tetratricopeptide (TPR) repeat protein
MSTRGGTALVTLPGLSIFAGLDVNEITLALPAVPETAPTLRQLQRRRLELRKFVVRLTQAAVDARVHQLTPEFARRGIQRVEVRLGEKRIAVSLRLEDGEVAGAVRLSPTGTLLQFVGEDGRGADDRAGTARMIARVVELLIAAPGVSPAQSASGHLDLLAALQWRMFPARGWRLPSRDGAEIIAVAHSAGAVEVHIEKKRERSRSSSPVKNTSAAARLETPAPPPPPAAVPVPPVAAAPRPEPPGALSVSLDDLVDALPSEPDDALDDKIHGLIELAQAAFGDDATRSYTKAAELSVVRAEMRARSGNLVGAAADWEQAHRLAQSHAPAIAGQAARALLDNTAADSVSEKRWIDSVLAALPPPNEAATMLIRRAQLALAEGGEGDAESTALLDLQRACDITTDPELRQRAQTLQAQVLDRVGKSVTVTGVPAPTELRAEPTAGGTQSVTGGERLRIMRAAAEASWRRRDFIEVIRTCRALLTEPTIASSRDRSELSLRLSLALDKVGESAAAAQGLDELLAATWTIPDVRDAALEQRCALAEATLPVDQATELIERLSTLEALRPVQRASALCRAGLLHLGRGRVQRAEGCFDEACALVENFAPALDGLESVYSETRDLNRLAVVLGRKIASATNPEQQKQLLSRLAEASVELGHLEVARISYQRALDIDPTFRTALWYLARDQRRRANWDESARYYCLLAESLMRSGAATPGLEREQALAEMEELRSQHSQHPALTAAADRLQKLLLSISAGNERIRSASPSATEALRAAVEADLSRDDFAAAANHLRSLALVFQRQHQSTRRAETLLDLADLLYDRLQSPDEARQAWRGAAEAFPEGIRRDTTWRMVATDAMAHDEWEQALDAWMQIPEGRRTSFDQREMDRAEQALSPVVEVALDASTPPAASSGLLFPSSQTDLRIHVAALRRASADEARSYLESLLDSVSGPLRAQVLLELALLARDVDHDPASSTSLLEQAYHTAPGHTPVWLPLADAWVANDDLSSAAELYDQIGDSREFEESLREWARQRAQTLHRGDGVVSGEIVSSEHASRSDLETARLLARKGDWEAAAAIAEAVLDSNPLDAGALALLVEHYQRGDDSAALDSALDRQIAATTDASTRALLWMRRARVHQREGRSDDMYYCLKEAHAAHPDDAEIAHQLRSQTMVRGDWELAAQLLYREIAGAQNDVDRAALHLELALIFDERLHDPAQALRNLEQADALDPTIPAATQKLAMHYQAAGRFAHAATMFVRAGQLAAEPAKTQLLARAMACDATHAAEPDPTVADLEYRLALAQSRGETHLGQELATALWKLDPGNRIAFGALADKPRHQGDMARLEQLVWVRASTMTEGRERAEFWCDFGHWALEHGDAERAASAFDRGLVDDPDHTGVIEARAELAFRHDDWATADILYAHLPMRATAGASGELLLRRSLLAEKLGRIEDALALAQAAAAVDEVKWTALLRVIDLARATHDLGRAVTAARAALALVPLTDKAQLVARRQVLADLLAALGDPAAAEQELVEILHLEPFHESALLRLVELTTEAGRIEHAIEYLRQLALHTEQADLRALRFCKIGELYAYSLGDHDRGADYFFRAADLAPSNVAILRRLVDVYWRAGDRTALVELARELSAEAALGEWPATTVARAAIALAASGDVELARRFVLFLPASTDALAAAEAEARSYFSDAPHVDLRALRALAAP